MSEQSSGADRLLQGLTPEQREAVTSAASPLCVLAGAGSGKTRVLTHRIAWQAASGQIDPQHVLAVTFTRRAAGELRRRLRGLGFAQDVAAGTFHASALAMLRRYWAERGERQPTILSRRLGLLKDLRPAWNWARLFAIDDEIAWASRRMVPPEAYSEGAAAARRRGSLQMADAAEVYREYLDAKRERGLIDFDDMLALAHKALISDACFAADQHRRQRHILVDEFQDVNFLQFELLKAWLGPESTVVVVGDPKQAIFAWRGAEPELLEQIEHHIPGVSVVPLTTNFRSTPEILGAAARLLGVEPQPAVKPPGRRPSVSQVLGWVPDGADTALYEAREIVKAVLRAHRSGSPWSHQAVLARTNRQLEPIAEALKDAGIPVRSREKKQARRQIRRIEKLLDGYEPADRMMLLITELSPEASEVGANRSAEGSGSPSGDLGGLRASLLEFARDTVALDPAATIVDLFRALEDDEGWFPLDDGVDLSTIHKAKGLEWPVVHIIGAEEGYLPHFWARTESTLREERRLFYVAATRTEQELNISWCRQRTRGKRVISRQPSRWLGAVNDRAAPLRAGPPQDRPSTREAAANRPTPEDSQGPERPVSAVPEAPSPDAAAGSVPDDPESLSLPVHTGPAFFTSLSKPAARRSNRISSADELLEGLSSEQLQAVISETPSLLVTGGPGSGKTLVLERRIAWLVATGAVEPERILVVTHSQRAADDLGRKFRELEVAGLPRAGAVLDTTMAAVYNRRATGELRRELQRMGADGPTIGTLDEIAKRLLHGLWGGAPGMSESPPSIVKRWDVLTGLYSEWNWGKLAALNGEIDWACACMLTPVEYPEAAIAAGRRKRETATIVSEQYRAYTEHKRRLGVIDESDVLVELAQVLRVSPQLASGLHLLIDEFEEANRLHLDVVKTWSDSDGMLTVTGDPNQSIYGWMGAEPEILGRIQQHLPAASAVNLTHNFRYTPDVAETVSYIGSGHLSTLAPEGDGLTVRELLGEEVLDDLPVGNYAELEAERVAQAVRHACRPGESWRCQAVLVHKNDQLKTIRQALDVAGVPSRTLNTKRKSLDNAVSLSTIHKAKGLEWPTVHIVGVEEGHFPHSLSKTVRAIEGDRRQLYVAASRAQRELHIYWCRLRKKGRKVVERQPSRWIKELLAASDIRREDVTGASDQRPDRASRIPARPEASDTVNGADAPPTPTVGNHRAVPAKPKDSLSGGSLSPPPPQSLPRVVFCRQCQAEGVNVEADIDNLCVVHYVEARQPGGASGRPGWPA